MQESILETVHRTVYVPQVTRLETPEHLDAQATEVKVEEKIMRLTGGYAVREALYSD